MLAKLLDADCYGYELTESISKGIAISPGTLYLILKRLKDDGSVETYLKESTEGPARKYYHLTDKGRQVQKELEGEWRELVVSVEKLLRGE